MFLNLMEMVIKGYFFEIYMDENEFDERYSDRDLRTEISLLQYHREVGIDETIEKINKLTGKPRKKILPPDTFSHTIPIFKSIASYLDSLLKNNPELKTFGDIRESDSDAYETVREEMLICINEYFYR